MKRIIAIAGTAGAGKDTVANMLKEVFLAPYKVEFADPLKHFCQEVFEFTDEQLYGPSEERNRPDTRYVRPNGEHLTARFALQTLGTEWGRNCCEDIWIRYGLRTARRILEANKHGTVLIPGIRFMNELDALVKFGAEVWLVQRPGAGLKDEAGGTHPSEADVRSPEFFERCTRVIHNTGTVEELRDRVTDAAHAFEERLVNERC